MTSYATRRQDLYTDNISCDMTSCVHKHINAMAMLMMMMNAIIMQAGRGVLQATYMQRQQGILFAIVDR